VKDLLRSHAVIYMVHCKTSILEMVYNRDFVTGYLQQATNRK